MLKRTVARRIDLIAATLLILLITLSFSISTVADELAVPSHISPPVGTHEGVNVEQPIEFPHNKHVVENKINCMYCRV